MLAPITPQNEILQPILSTKNTDTSPSSPSDEDEVKPGQVTDSKSLKRRRTDNGTVTTAVETLVKQDNNEQQDTVKKTGKESRRGGVPFQRIKVDKVSFQDVRLMDNTFASRVGRIDPFLSSWVLMPPRVQATRTTGRRHHRI